MVTNTRTNDDNIPIAVLNEMLGSGEISTSDLSIEKYGEWAAWEPDPLPMNSFTLSDPAQREEFLYQYCYYGEPLLLAAVAHIWDSLAEPRQLRCALIGQACGTGGSGKLALALMLNQMLHECCEIGAVLPDKAGYGGPDDYHRAVTDHFATTYDQERALCRAYSAILDGANSAAKP